jgi:hypothetical protein
MMSLIHPYRPMGLNPTRVSRAARSGAPGGGLLHWMVETINHVFGNPREEAAHQPPAVGVQPYRDRPVRVR